MSLQPGTQLGPYEILSQIGAGGMGEVYKARDTRLNRFIAIKILPVHLAEQPELRERFKREAETIAKLNHPHICTLHDIGSQDGTDYLVMEYLEGETLAERLKKGSLPLDQVLRYAVEVSDALDKAHRAGVTHRDIKPGNIIVTKDGIKLLDFGLAKLKQEVFRTITPASEMPTVPGALTEHGTLLGTLHYMAPEQVEGKINEIDARTDIFAFGALVYEMATGKKAFPGETQASVIAKILEVDPPPMSALQPMTPPVLDRVVRRCLAKDAEDRWQAIRDICHELKWITEGEGQAAQPVPLQRHGRLRQRLGWAVAAGAVLAFLVGLFLVGLFFLSAPTEESAIRFSIPPPENAQFPGNITVPPAVLSPDGKRVALFAVGADGIQRLWIRSFDSLTAQLVPGTEAVLDAFWSPDGRYIAFQAEGKLKRVDPSGGPPQTLADVAGGSWGGTWSSNGVILLGGGVRQGGGLSRVPSSGGEPTPITTPDSSQGVINHRQPHFLPDGRHFVYWIGSQDLDDTGTYLGSLDSNESRLLVKNGLRPQYSAGHLLFVREGTLLAQPFDADRLMFTGEAFPVAEEIGYSPATSEAAFSVSGNGALIYRSQGSGNSQLTWFDRGGKPLGTVGPPGVYRNLNLSPDGRRVSVEQVNARNRDIWLIDLLRDSPTRFTFDPGEEWNPIWSPDGSRLAFTSNRGGVARLYQKPTSGAATEEVVLENVAFEAPFDWSLDGQLLVYRGAEAGTDLWVLPLSGNRKPFPFFQTLQFVESQAKISPNGRWIAYLSSESGRDEVYVQSFPMAGAKWQVSTDGGVQPRWRRDGKELFYIARDRRLMAVPVRGEDSLEFGSPDALFETRTVEDIARGPYLRHQYDVAPDGQRFLMNVVAERSPSPLTVVLNWAAGIRADRGE